MRRPSDIPWKPSDTIEREIEVVTLVHGGGPIAAREAGQLRPHRDIDPHSPLRGTAIRGHLRFWWRATHGCTSASLREMREREDALWGTTGSSNGDGKGSGPGRVAISVEGQCTTTNVEKHQFGSLDYGAFATANLAQITGDARLVLRLRDVSDRERTEVGDAVTAWLLFGGIGGRTRRGFGAVHSNGLPSPSRFIERFTREKTLRLVPTLHRATLKCGPRATSAHPPPPPPRARTPHELLIRALFTFRQGVGLARNKKENGNRRNDDAGRSRWPEADAIRRITRRHSPGHAPEHSVEAFPRAEFGMPIVFSFKDERAGDPQRQTLAPSSPLANRMASPLILRPVWTDGNWQPAALRLRVPGLDLKEARLEGVRQPVRVRLQPAEAEKIAPLGGTVDPIEAFVDPIEAFMNHLETL